MKLGTNFSYIGLDGLHHYGYYSGIDAYQHTFWFEDLKETLHVPLEYQHMMGLGIH